jgi:general secretion pathway protein B
MSFILDALRKSEIERQRQAGPSMAEFPVARADRRLPIALVVIGGLLVVNIAVVVFFMLRDARAPAAAATQVATAQPSSVTSAPAAGAAPARQATGPSALESEALGPPEFQEPPVETYGAPATQPPDPPDPTLLPETPSPAGNVTYSDAPPAEEVASVEAATGLPELSVDLHVFADDPAKRAVFINGRRYTRGDRIAEGPIVEEITRDGALLSYRGRRFLLPRL